MYRVLLVDDDLHILNTNEKFFRLKGYEVFRAMDAETALRVASTAALDAIVLVHYCTNRRVKTGLFNKHMA